MGSRNMATAETWYSEVSSSLLYVPRFTFYFAHSLQTAMLIFGTEMVPEY
jgi:hypothetical protein